MKKRAFAHKPGEQLRFSVQVPAATLLQQPEPRPVLRSARYSAQEGIGTAIGGLLGILTGAAAGAVAGNTVGKLVDENVFRIWKCTACGYEWRAA